MTQPNILLVIADDQPKGLMDAMPAVSAKVKDQGIWMKNAISQTSLCSPSRASILTGNFSNKTGVWTNDGANGAWPAFNANPANEANTLGTKLSAAGYYTALVGKYINKFSDSPAGYIPPGWDTFITMVTGGGEGAGSYYNYTLRGTEPDEYHGYDVSDYSTDVLKQKCLDTIYSKADPAKPLLLIYTPWGPHGNYEPAPRHLGTWTGDTTLPGSFNEADLSDKPQWMQNTPLADEAKQKTDLASMHEAVMSIDEGVDAILNALAYAGRDQNLMVVYMSDNGKMLGSHRLTKKDLPHRWSGEVPVFVRWNGVIAPGTSNNSRVTPNVDVTATIAEAAGITGWTMDGKSILTTNRAGGCPTAQRDNFKDQGHPGYIGWRAPNYLYVEYSEGKGAEFYDYTSDPDELYNLINSNDPQVQSKINDLKTKARAAQPYPPNFVLV